MSSTAETRDNRIRDFDFDLDQLLLQLVIRSHPEWQRPDGSCPTCWLEIQRLRAPVVSVPVLGACGRGQNPLDAPVSGRHRRLTPLGRLAQEFAHRVADPLHLPLEQVRVLLSGRHQTKRHGTATVDDVVGHIGDAAFHQPRGVAGLGQLVVGRAGYQTTGEPGNRVAIHRGADGARCVDVALG